MDKLCQFNVFLEGGTGSNSNLIFCETRLAKICGKPYSKLKLLMLIVKQNLKLTRRPHSLKKKRKSVAGAAKFHTTLK